MNSLNSIYHDRHQDLMVATSKGHSFSIKALERHSFSERSQGTSQHYKLVFLRKGRCSYMLDKKKIDLNSSSIGIIRPHQGFHHLECLSAEGYILSFSFDYLQLAIISSPHVQQLHLGISNLETVPVPSSDHEFLCDVSKRLLQEFDNTSGMKEEVVRGLFQVFAIYLSRATTQLVPVSGSKCNRHTKRFFTLLDQHFRTRKMPADYAEMMAVTPAYLNTIIKDTLGFTTSYFIQQRILTEAKRLMMYEELNMKEVAFKLGFFDVSHFSKFFKRITGERFTDFKRNAAA